MFVHLIYFSCYLSLTFILFLGLGKSALHSQGWETGLQTCNAYLRFQQNSAEDSQTSLDYLKMYAPNKNEASSPAVDCPVQSKEDRCLHVYTLKSLELMYACQVAWKPWEAVETCLHIGPPRPQKLLVSTLFLQ